MSRPPSSQTTPQFYRVSERDLTEIELHSVDSINDLHRTHHDHSHKIRPPRPSYTPSSNGNLPSFEPAVSQTSRPISSWQGRVQDMFTPTSSRAYALSCAIVALLLLTVLLIFYFLVQQGGAIRRLTEAVTEKKSSAAELTKLIQELQKLSLNLTALSRTS